jgi:hypothetical protein
LALPHHDALAIERHLAMCAAIGGMNLVIGEPPLALSLHGREALNIPAGRQSLQRLRHSPGHRDPSWRAFLVPIIVRLELTAVDRDAGLSEKAHRAAEPIFSVPLGDVDADVLPK